MAEQATKGKPEKNPIKILKQLVTNGQLDEDTAQFLRSIAEQAVVVRDAGRTILEAYNKILDAIAIVRGNLNVVLDNVEDVENLNEETK